MKKKDDSSLKFIFFLLSSFLGYGIGIIINREVNSEDKVIFSFFSTSLVTALSMFLSDRFLLPSLNNKIETSDKKRELKHELKMTQIKREMKQLRHSLSDKDLKIEAIAYQSKEILTAQILKGEKK